MKNTTYYLSLLCIALLTSCSQFKSKLSDSYQPMEPGSTWTYKIETPGAPADKQTETVADGVYNFAGKAYHKMVVHLKSKDSTSYNYYAQKGNDYFIRPALTKSAVNDLNLELLYLKDNMAAGGGWSGGEGKGNSTAMFTSNVKGEIIETEISKTINGNTYKDIIHTRIIVSIVMKMDIGIDSSMRADMKNWGVPLGNMTQNFTVDFYMAKGIGLVESDITMSGMGASATVKQTLLSYVIK